MLARFTDLLAEARAQRRATGAFTAYNLETATAVLRAAEARGTGVILLVSEAAFRAPGGVSLVAGLCSAADTAAVPCCVQLDHVADLELMRAALAAGCAAVMADGSRLGDEDNVALVAGAVALARPHGAEVEAELGRIEGDEEIAAATRAGALTDPDQAAAFMAATGAGCLAVSIGNVHGTYAAPPRLDWQRLAAIGAAVDKPLSLHGASGLGAGDLERCVTAGICKVNVNTELRERYFAVLAERVSELSGGARMLALAEALVDGVAGVVGEKLDALGPYGPTKV
jgi:tagatose 1,6-diphosphate aldolase GatY/KbaY